MSILGFRSSSSVPKRISIDIPDSQANTYEYADLSGGRVFSQTKKMVPPGSGGTGGYSSSGRTRSRISSRIPMNYRLLRFMFSTDMKILWIWGMLGAAISPAILLLIFNH